jgi:nitrite reductase (NO-forming)
MRVMKMVGTIVAVGLLGGWIVAATARENVTTERVDFGAVRTSTTPAFDARVQPVGEAEVKEFRIPMTHDTIEIANGVRYVGWTFGGTVPGPVIRVRQGDLVRINLVNEARDMPHSIDFHASRIPMNHAMKSIAPGDSLQFEFTATTAGVFMVHCGTPPVLLHIAQGMYLPIIVDPIGGWPGKVDKEFVVVQSEFYAQPTAANVSVMEGNWEAMTANQASHVVFNGSAFQVVGAIVDAVYPSGNPQEVLHGIQTWDVPVGGGAVFETSFDPGMSGEGTYAFVTHAFADATKGAIGIIKVGQTAVAAAH